MSAARKHLAAIASAPRPAGGEAESRAREYCAGVLRAAGLEVAERRFDYSEFPGKWGTPIAGLATAVIFLCAGRAGMHGNARAALEILLVGVLGLAIVAGVLTRWGVLDFPIARAASTNLIATRGVPSLWLVAHLDSKSQPISIGVRASAIIASIVLWILAAALAAAQLAGAAPAWLWMPVSLLGVLVSIPVMASVVGARSAGALDDASGVVTVLRAAELLPRDASIGVLLTSAEELGLAGARAWAREAAPARAINVDGVDDSGGARLIYSGRAPRELLAGFSGEWPAARRLLPGLLMDGVALADAGWQVVNISKGSWRTVSRIHTPRDDLARLEGSGAEEIAAMLAAAIVGKLR